MTYSSKKSIISLLANDNFFMVNRKIASIIGLTTAVFLSELLSKLEFFEKNGSLCEINGHGDGWFYLTVESVRQRTTLTADQQKPIVKNLVESGLIQMVVKGLPARRYFKVDVDKMVFLLENQNYFIEQGKSTNWIQEIPRIVNGKIHELRPVPPLNTEETYKDTYLRECRSPSADDAPPPKNSGYSTSFLPIPLGEIVHRELEAVPP